MSSRPLSSSRGSRTPLWVLEGLDIVQRRAGLLRTIVAVVCLAGLAAARFLPAVVPATWPVGAAVALAALLLGLAAAIAADSADLTLRGPRHVKAAGGELVAVMSADLDPSEADPLADAVLDARRPGAKLILGLAAAGRDARHTVALTDALALSIAQRGASVLRLDLASGRSERPGLYEVLRRGHRLADAVEFEPGPVALARLGAGRDLAAALEAMPELPARLPRDLDVLLVTLPTAASRPSIRAATALDHVLVVAERDLTSRVDLIAGLDALEAVGIAAQVVLLDDVTASRLAPAASVPTVPDPEPVVPGPDPQPVPPPEPDPQPQPVPDPQPEPDPQPDPQPQPQPQPDPEPDPQPAPAASAPVVPEPAPTTPEPVDPEPEPQPDPEPVRDEPPAAARHDAETTSRLRPVDTSDPWGPDDDPLRTTAQLAVLLDDLEARRED